MRCGEALQLPLLNQREPDQSAVMAATISSSAASA